MLQFRPRPFLVRPNPELAARFPNAWFGHVHVWYVPSLVERGDPEQRRIAEAHLRLAVLAEIHQAGGTSDTDEQTVAARLAANELLASKRTLVFDELFTIEPIGEPHHFDCDMISLPALRAVLPPRDADVQVPYRTPGGRLATWSLYHSWSWAIGTRDATCEVVLLALRHVVPKLLDTLANELGGRACEISGFGEIPGRDACAALARELGLVPTGERVLHVRATRWDSPEVVVEYAVRGEASMPQRNRELTRGEVHARIGAVEGALAVTTATMVSQTRRPLE